MVFKDCCFILNIECKVLVGNDGDVQFLLITLYCLLIEEMIHPLVLRYYNFPTIQYLSHTSVLLLAPCHCRPPPGLNRLQKF